MDLWIADASKEVVTTASGLIAGASDLAVDAEGQVYILDYRARAIHVVDSTGHLIRTMGRPGRGPGELERPASFRVYPDSVVVVDQGNQRFQSFTDAGEPLGSQPIPECAQGAAAPTLGPGGLLVRPTIGMDSGLAVLCSRQGEEQATIGEPLAPVSSVIDMVEVRAEILEGGVPGFLLNLVSPVVGQDGSVWLVLPAAHRADRHEGGERVTTVTLHEPEFEAVRADWMTEVEEREQPGVPGLRYLLRAREAGGMLWILTHTGDEPFAKVVVVSRAGEVVARLHFADVAGAGDFAVDLEGGWIYFYIPERAELVRVVLDAEVPPGMGVASQGR
ncbi:MAG: 6-bladed beta-propeller [Longimicrobiales bacterium]|nr:6-bladed beta-propeller [Longimicrobiales bacterium]